jgi:hypothetical protein
MPTITFRPLTQWPAGRERTAEWRREEAPFKASGRYVEGQRIGGGRTPVSTTYDELDREMNMISAKEIVVQIDIRDERELRRSDSFPLAGAVVKSPAIVLSFRRGNTPYVFATDWFRRWDDNLRAIVLGLEGLRRLERYHVAQSGDQYRGWQALPSTTTTALSVEAAAEVIAKRSSFSAGVIIESIENAKGACRQASARCHPDVGGATADFQLVQEAKRVLELFHGVGYE